MSINLKNKNIVVTGASRGFGKYLASKLWNYGANLVLTARSESSIESLIPDGDQKLFKLSADMNTVGIGQQIVDYAIERMKKIDVLINNAAIIGPIGMAVDNDWKAWEETIRVNMMAPIELCMAVLPSMVKQGGGKIINLSGGGATNARPNFSAYATSKTGMVRFTETIAAEMRHANIQVNCVAPGVMYTDMLTEAINAGDNINCHDDGSSMIKPAELIAFLASDNSRGITGKLISAVWDPWEKFHEHASELNNTDIYTLRRTVI